MRFLILMVVVGIATHGCASTDTGEHCYQLQQQCIDAGRCLDSSNNGKTSGEGEYGDTIGASASDEASCHISCVPCDEGSVINEGGGSTGAPAGGPSVAGSAGHSGTAPLDGGGSGSAGAAISGSGSGKGGASDMTFIGGSCGLVAFAGSCTSCIETEAECCAAATDCAAETACAATWQCFQACEARGEAWCAACNDTPERAVAFNWGALANCLVRRCNEVDAVCAALGT